ncbi:MAG: helix-turn-helix transcriptional regulator [Clostridia bacterium]|nr:helix-turn-helix transcriptional regulator [Clostridia bacterium]
MIEKSFYHQTENTNRSEISTYIYDYNSWEFNSLHFHKNYEILLMLEGECDCTVGGKHYRITPGEAIFILPFQVHAFFVRPGSAVRCVTFSDLLMLTLAKILDKKRIVDPVFHPSKEILDFFLNGILENFGRRSGHNINIPTQKRMRLKGYLYTLGAELLDQVELTDADNTDITAMEIVEYISDHFQSDISLHNVAEAKGYNYQYLSRVFNRTFGIHFKTMVNQYRTNHALQLLRDTELPLSEIAFESGFGSIRSFDHVFRESLGRSPKDFRREKL